MKRCVVFVENGYTQLMLPSGEMLPGEVNSVLTNPFSIDDENPSTYQATFIVDVVSTREEALKLLDIEEKV